MLKRNIKDFYFQKAKDAGYPARSVYKLKEANERHRFLREGHSVLDLGSFPGSWLKYSAEIVGPKGFVLGIDHKEIEAPGGTIHFLRRDVLALDPEEIRKIRDVFDVVLSDLAPPTSGTKIVDHVRSIELARRALSIAVSLLKKGGTFFVKVFQGEDLGALEKEIKEHFANLRYFKPKSSRPESKEIFILALNKIS